MLLDAGSRYNALSYHREMNVWGSTWNPLRITDME